MVGETNLCCRLVLTLTAGKCHITVFRLHVTEAGGFTVELVATNLAVIIIYLPRDSRSRGSLHLLVQWMVSSTVILYFNRVCCLKWTEAANKVSSDGVSGLDVQLQRALD